MSIRPGLLGKYELRERLGQGGMAEVWKAFDQRLQRFVAIKFLHTTLRDDPTFMSRFVREARAVASLRHPNIVQVYDFEAPSPDSQEQQAYMVMDYIEGPTLASYLATSSYARNFPSAAETISLFYSIGEAVDYAHQRGLLHRDIKPANILLDKHHTARNSMGEPILTDFGIVKMMGSAPGTLTSSALGTPIYMAPEQALGQPCSAASDIYSLGVVLYEMCAGARPFAGPTPLAILQQHVTAPPPSPELFNPAITPALASVILQCLAKEPTERFPTAMALTAALAQAFSLPLPTRLSQPISAPDIRDLPISASDIRELPVEQEAITEVPPTLISEEAATTPRGHGEQAARAATPIPPSEPMFPPPSRSPRKQGRRRVLFTLLSACALVVLLVSGLTIFLHRSTPPSAGPTQAAGTAQIVGNAFFASSGAANGAQNLGLNDTFQIRLTNVAPPAAGHQYYAWLMPDQTQTEANPRALGSLTVTGGVAALPAPYIDPQHTNLVELFSGFLVTEENAHPTPQNPSLDKALWRYSAYLPQNPPLKTCSNVINQLNALCHLRHLLSGDPELAQVHLPGGLSYWFLNNTKEVQKWAREGVDHSDPLDIRHKIVNILSLLDGRSCIQQDIHNAAPGFDNTPDDNTISTIAALPLLNCDLTPDVPGYLSHIHNHLNAMLRSVGAQSDQAALAIEVGSELNVVNDWLTGIQKDARQLLAMSDQQLLQTQGQSLRHEIDTLATNALSGGTDVATGNLEKGVVSITEQIQHLATMDVTHFTPAQ